MSNILVSLHCPLCNTAQLITPQSRVSQAGHPPFAPGDNRWLVVERIWSKVSQPEQTAASQLFLLHIVAGTAGKYDVKKKKTPRAYKSWANLTFLISRICFLSGSQQEHTARADFKVHTANRNEPRPSALYSAWYLAL